MVKLALLRRIPKYYKMGERLPGGAGVVLNDSITCTVRKISWRKYVMIVKTWDWEKEIILLGSWQQPSLLCHTDHFGTEDIEVCPWRNDLHTTTRVAQSTWVYIRSSITPRTGLVLVVVSRVVLPSDFVWWLRIHVISVLDTTSSRISSAASFSHWPQPVPITLGIQSWWSLAQWFACNHPSSTEHPSLYARRLCRPPRPPRPGAPVSPSAPPRPPLTYSAKACHIIVIQPTNTNTTTKILLTILFLEVRSNLWEDRLTRSTAIEWYFEPEMTPYRGLQEKSQ